MAELPIVDVEIASFHWIDYTVLAGSMLVSMAIGLWFGCSGPKQRTANDFLLGGASMSAWPTALSLATSFITAIELLGNPAEMYMHGTQFWMTILSFLIAVPLASSIFLPLYRDLKITSAFEYLEMRFGARIRTLAALMYASQMVVYTSVAVYAPALALSHVTGLNTYVAVACVYLICVGYSAQGGLKAVVMTDTFQTLVLAASLIAVMAIGDNLAGGFSTIWKAVSDSGRTQIWDFNPSATVRHSFWSVVIGGTFYWVSMFSANQASVQKLVSVSTTSQARMALWVSAILLIIIYTINFYTGAALYTIYQHCDPLTLKKVEAADELLPFWVMRQMGKFHGIPGLFVAGIFSASLGTVASALNSLAAVTVQDFVIGTFGVQLPENRGAILGKWISVGFGLISFGLVFVVEQLGSILQVALSFNGMVGGVTLGLFALGACFPWANSKGAAAGAITGVAIVSWICLGAQVAVAKGYIDNEPLPLSIDQCIGLNITDHIEVISTNKEPELWWFYRISYLWYSALGTVITIIIGLAVSAFFTNENKVDPSLISPPIRRLLAVKNKLQEKPSKMIAIAVTASSGKYTPTAIKH